MDAYFFGGLLRAAQSLLQSAPFLVCGLLVAGVYRRLLGHDNVRRLYGEGTWHSHIQAWAIGMILPIDSLGTIPVMREMRRAGLSGGTILAFGLTEPLFSPLSLLYGLTLSEPTAILAFAACSLVVVTGVGLIFDRVFPNTSHAEPSLPPAVPGIKRLASVIFAGAREAAGGSAAFIGIGLVGVMLLSFALPPGSLQGSVGADNVFAPVLMAVIAVPAYATPMTAMSQLGMMFQHGNSVGAAFTLLVLGAGMTLGTLAWAWKAYGLVRTLGLLTILLGITLGLSYGVERPLYPKDIEPANHTHAFDIYCRPYQVGAVDVAGQAWKTLRENTQLHEKFGSMILAGYLLIGLVLRVGGGNGKLERWTETDSRAPQASTEVGSAHWTEMKVPPVALGATVIAVLVAVSVVGCYAYYPSPDEVFEELRIAQGEALSGSLSGDLDHAEYWLPRYADWVRKLQVGAFLRQGKLSEHRRLKAKLLLDRLELLEHELAHHDPAELRELIALIQRTHRRLREAYS